MVEFTDGLRLHLKRLQSCRIKEGSELTKINEALAKVSEEQRKELMDNAIKNQPGAE